MQNKKERTFRESLEKLEHNIFDIALFVIFIYCILQLMKIHVPVDELYISFMGR